MYTTTLQKRRQMEFFEPEIINTKIVGTTFEGRQQVIQAVERISKTNRDDVKIFLKQEKDNAYDPCAIAVCVTYFDGKFLSEVTRQIGYLRRELASAFTEDINNGYDFVVLEFEATGGYEKSRGVNIKVLRKEADMPTVTAMDLLKKKTGSSTGTEFLRLKEGTVLTLRFLKPLSEAYIQATHSIPMPDGKYERFAALQYVKGVFDETIEDPALVIDPKPWIKLVLPVIDRADGKVKLFSETLAVFRKFQLFEEQPSNDAEKAIKLGGLTNADVQIFQQGKGKDRQINAFPVPGTIRPLSVEEKKLAIPDLTAGQRILTKEEIKKIVDIAARNQAGIVAGMAVTPPQVGAFTE
jgi:hypothetical protein